VACAISIGTAAQYAEQDLCNGVMSVCQSVPARAHSSKPATAGLGLAGRIYRSIAARSTGAQQQRRANAGSAASSAYVGSLLSPVWLQDVSLKDVEDYKEAVLSVFDKNTDGRLSRRELGLLLSIEI